MKILHINCNYIGTALHQTMIEHLNEFGVENSVFVPTYSKDIAVIDVNNYVNVSECFKKKDRVLFEYKSRKIREALKKIYDVDDFDLIHAYTLFTDGNVAYKLYQEFGIPYVVAIRNTDVNAFLKYMFFLRHRAVEIMEHAKAVFFLSQTYKEKVFQKYIPNNKRELIASKTHIVSNGIDDYWFENLYFERSPYTGERPLEVIYAGGIDRNKNIDTTLKSLSILREQGMKINFTVIGKIKDSKVFEKIDADLNTSYIEAQPKEELIKYYRRADIFVMPSHTETFGLVYAEAMSQGLPIIYTKGQGFDGQFPEGTVGYHVNDYDPENVAKAIVLIADNYGYHMKECINNIEKFRWNSICMKYLEYYKSSIVKK